MECLKGRNFAIVDVETSGTSPARSRVIEIGILRIEDGVCVETFHTCINPQDFVPQWIFDLTGLEPSEIEVAPLFEDVIDTLERLFDNAIFVAHSASFDLGFVQSEFARLERTFSPKVLCSVRLSRMLSPHARSHSLSALIQRHRFACKARHRAFDDAHVVWQFLQLAARKHTSRLPAVMDFLLKKKSARRSWVPSAEYRDEAVIQ